MSRSVCSRRRDVDFDADADDDSIHPEKSDPNTPERIMADTRFEVRRRPIIKDSS